MFLAYPDVDITDIWSIIHPDGFYEIRVVDICDPAPKLFVGTEGDPYHFELGPVSGSIVVKFTEAPGANPSMKRIGSSNGQAGAVIRHITLPSDPVITARDASGNESTCTGCIVPPPPKEES